MNHQFIIVQLILNLLICNYLYSQKAYSPGYVILNSGDTLYGEIRDRDINGRNAIYKKIRFVPDSGRKQKFSAYQIKGYTADDTEFQSMWYNEYSEFFTFHYVSRYGVGEKIFLRVIKRGNITCYYREYIDPDSGYPDGFELFKREGDDYFVRATQGIFGLKKRRLAEYFIDCPKLVENIENGTITKPLEVVDFYNKHCISK